MPTKTTSRPVPAPAASPALPITPLVRLATRRADLEARSAAIRGALAQLDADTLAQPDAPADPTRATKLAELSTVERERALCDATQAELQARATTQAAAARAEVLSGLEARLAEYERTATARRQRLDETAATLADLEAAVAADRLVLACRHDLYEVTQDRRVLRQMDLHVIYRPYGGDGAACLQRHVRRPPMVKPREWEALLARCRALTPEAGR